MCVATSVTARHSSTHLIWFSSLPSLLSLSLMTADVPASWLTLASSRTIWLCFASRQSFSVCIWPACDSSSDIIMLVSLDTSSTRSEIWNWQKHTWGDGWETVHIVSLNGSYNVIWWSSLIRVLSVLITTICWFIILFQNSTPVTSVDVCTFWLIFGALQIL